MDRVLEFSSGEGLLRWVENHRRAESDFLDMEMGELDGMETARRLRRIEESLPLVFVTGYTEHVFEDTRWGLWAIFSNLYGRIS